MSVGSVPVTIGLLGPVAVDAGDGMVEIPGTRARRLLAALTLTPGAIRSASVLIDLVWSDAQPKSPQSALHTQISRLRQALPDGMIAVGSAGYRLDLTGHTVDLDRARNLIDDGTARSLDDAARLWRGVPGDDLGGDELAAEVRAVGDELRRRLDERRCRVALDAGDHETARRVAQTLCDHDPLDEPAHLLLMRALQAAGRINDALAVHARLRRALSVELGVDPGPAIAAAHRDLLNPAEPVVAVVHPVRRANRTPVGLRAEPNELFGRAVDIDDVATALGQHRVVTIAGPGGAGKTRLAQAVGRRIAGQGRSVFVVELASVRSDDDVIGAVAATLGVGETDLTPSGTPRIPVGDLSVRLADALGGRDSLLILDNCEQIISGSARVVSDLISAVADLTVLTTSRAPLLVAGEGIHLLAPLAVENVGSPAVELFAVRARAVRPDVAIDAEVVAALCRDLDGLPLAIELAAARVRTLSVPDVARLLSERLAHGRLDLLRTGDRTAPERHRTLNAVIGWSWDLLDPAAQDALLRLCRFPAGFSAEAAAVVLDTDVMAVDEVLESLVNQSLLSVSETRGRIRYRMLEMVREFGEERLVASGKGPHVNAAMTRWAIAWAVETRRRYEDSDQSGAMADVVADSDNLVWVLRCCTDLDSEVRPEGHVTAVITVFSVLACSWVARGLHVEVRNWAPRILTIADHPPAELPEQEREQWQLVLLMVAGHVLMLSIDLRLLARAMTALRRMHRPAMTLTLPAEFTSAIMLSRMGYGGLRVISRGTRSDVPMVRAIALSVRSNTRENSGNLVGALRDSVLAQELAVARGDLWITAMGAMEIGSILGQAGNYSEAVGHYRRAMTMLRELGAEDESAQVGAYLACSLVGCGALDEARSHLAEMTDGWTPDAPLPPGNPATVATGLISFAEVAFASGDLSEAVQIASRTVRLLVEEHPGSGTDPSAMLVLSAAVALLSSAGGVDVAVDCLPVLARLGTDMFGPVGMRDLPQTGACALACGTALSASTSGSIDGARLMLLGERVGARLDYPILEHAMRSAPGLPGLTDESWRSLRDEIDRMPRRRAIEDILSILGRAIPSA